MRRACSILLLLLPGLLAVPAWADFEKWTNKDGKTVELELVDVRGEGAARKVEFRTKAFKIVTMSVSDLHESDQQKIAEIVRILAATTPVIEQESFIKGALNQISFIFNAKGPRVDQIKEGSLVMEPVKFADRVYKTENWSVYPEVSPTKSQFRLATSTLKPQDALEFEIRGSIVLYGFGETKTVQGEVPNPKGFNEKRKAKLEDVAVEIERDAEGNVRLKPTELNPNQVVSVVSIVDGERVRGLEFPKGRDRQTVELQYRVVKWEKRVSFTGKAK